MEISESPAVDGDKQRHAQLAGVVKGLHAKLRQRFRNSSGNFEQVWLDHQQDTKRLAEYADAMKHLATDIWSKQRETRIHWCQQICLEFFLQGGLQKALDKDERRRFHEQQKLIDYGCASKDAEQGSDATVQCPRKIPRMDSAPIENVPTKMFRTGCDSSTHTSPATEVTSSNVDVGVISDDKKKSLRDTCDTHTGGLTAIHDNDATQGQNEIRETHVDDSQQQRITSFDGKISLLDVGSCYHPFAEFEEFLPLGIDLCPAVESVYQCDFLNVKIVEPLDSSADALPKYIKTLSGPIHQLPRETFHVVVFSLLLEYFPSPAQRWICCEKASHLLRLNGLLIIITPDSSHQNRHVKMMRSWRVAIESLGFRRWRYVKQEHLHCMAYRKIRMYSNENKSEVTVNSDMLYIPQDSHAPVESAATSPAVTQTEETPL